MMAVWWTQAKAVARLELKKTFLARRGLWIYLVAAAPVFLFVIYAVAMSHQHSYSANLANKGERRLAYQDLLAIKPGMMRRVRPLRTPTS